MESSHYCSCYIALLITLTSRPAGVNDVQRVVGVHVDAVVLLAGVDDLAEVVLVPFRRDLGSTGRSL